VDATPAATPRAGLRQVEFAFVDEGREMSRAGYGAAALRVEAQGDGRGKAALQSAGEAIVDLAKSLPGEGKMAARARTMPTINDTAHRGFRAFAADVAEDDQGCVIFEGDDYEEVSADLVGRLVELVRT
jgi:hypothetical protein